jgi:thioredoxin
LKTTYIEQQQFNWKIIITIIMKIILLTLFSSTALVSSFAPSTNCIGSCSVRRRQRGLFVGSLASSVISNDFTSLNRRDIQEELKQLGVSYHDCFDKESLVHRLLEARAQGATTQKTHQQKHIYEPSSNTAVIEPILSTTTTVPAAQNVEEKLVELRGMSLKDLKLQCSRRNIRYYKFLEKEDFVQAIRTDMLKAVAFSVTGMVQPGMVVELTGEQLDQEMTRNDSLILVDVYATWCGPCRMVVPQLEAAAKQLGSMARIVKLDSDKHAAWAGRYQVQGLPTMLLIKDGRVVDRMEGAHMTERIVEFVKGHL